MLAIGHGKVKVLGSGMSYGAIGAVEKDDDVLLDVSRMAGSISFVGDEARFHASTLLQDVVDELVLRGLQLVCCPGVLLTQTIAGAIATGTHGQGRRGSISDAINDLTVVLADGSIRTYTKQSPEFKAFCLHLGIGP
jgi:FAD/FMN-containing dehydrogenase